VTFALFLNRANDPHERDGRVAEVWSVIDKAAIESQL
jgi:predicted ester cyclase